MMFLSVLTENARVPSFATFEFKWTASQTNDGHCRVNLFTLFSKTMISEITQRSIIVHGMTYLSILCFLAFIQGKANSV